MKKLLISFLILLGLATPSIAGMDYWGYLTFDSRTNTTQIFTAAQEEAGYMVYDDRTSRTKIYLDPTKTGGGTGGGGTWGSITGTLAAQTDLGLALAGKAPAFTSGTQNYFWATPNGSTGVPSLRAIVAADIPSLSYGDFKADGSVPLTGYLDFGIIAKPSAPTGAKYRLYFKSDTYPYFQDSGGTENKLAKFADIPSLAGYAQLGGATFTGAVGVSGGGTIAATSLATAYVDWNGSGGASILNKPTLATYTEPGTNLPICRTGVGTTGGCTITEHITATFDGGGSPITVNKIAYTHIPYNGTVSQWTVLCDVNTGTSGIVIDVYKDAYSANTLPTTTMLTTGTKPNVASGSNKTGQATWDGNITTITAGDSIGFKVMTAPTSCTWCTISLKVDRTF